MTTGPVVGPFDGLTVISGTTYTLSEQGVSYTNPPTGAGGDNRKTLNFTSASPIAVTIPGNLFVGFNCTFYPTGSGTVTFSVVGGGTLNGITNGIGTSTGQYSKQFLQCVGQNTDGTSIYVLTNEATITTHS